MLFQASALLALAASASAHLTLLSPTPFEFENSATKQAPLEPADFPCKQPGGTYAVTSMNTVAAGDSIKAQLKGGATHGGGSCQFSITTDTKPNAKSQWKVLHSQIHGCTGGAADANMSGNAEDTNNPIIPVKIPEDLPAGQYTFAWTWLNKLGNREFYMNCAPLTVTNSAKSADVSKVLGSKPDMFVANLPPTECEVASGQDFVYPNPGDSVATGTGAIPGTAISGANCAAVTVLGAGAGKLGSPAATTAAPSNAGGVFAPGASSAAASAPAASAPAASAPAASAPAASAPTPTAAAPVASQPAAAQPSTPSTGGSANGSGSGAASGGCTPCSTNGAVVCIGADSYGLCNWGCAVAQPLAAGMTCSNGAITRRSIRFPRGTLHSRHNALHKRSSLA